MGHDEEYHILRQLVADRIGRLAQPVYTTDILGDTVTQCFMSHLPSALRQYYTCHTCWGFLRRYGALVKLDERGRKSPAVLDLPAPEMFKPAIHDIASMVVNARVNGVFYRVNRTLGQPETGGWTHFYGVLARGVCAPPVGKTAGQARAAKRKEFSMLERARAVYTPDEVERACSILRTGQLSYRWQEMLAQAEWFLRALHQQNWSKLWQIVACAPAGWCHLRTGLLGALLDYIKRGLDYSEIKRHFAENTHPLRYRRHDG